jgi:CPA1 family monovalent cation:H+ antiporter
MSGLTVEASIVSALLVVVAVAVLVRRFNLPYTVALVVMGLLLGAFPVLPRFQLTPEIILLIFLPPLLFEASFNLEYQAVRENLVPILLLAVPGVVLGAGLIAGMLRLSLNLPIETLLVFGALVAATDPISVLALFHRLGAPKRLSTIVEGESLFNDGVAIVLFGVLLGWAEGGSLSVGSGIAEFIQVSLGGGLLGLLVGIIAIQLLQRIDDHLIEITITTIVAFGCYLSGELLHVSGVIAVVVAGLLLGRARDSLMSPTTRVTLGSFWEYLGFLGNSMIFLLVGMRIAAPQIMSHLGSLGWVMLAVLVSRAVIVVLINVVLRLVHEEMPWKWVPIVFWGGLRGAVALALALSLPVSLQDRLWIQLMAFGVVLVTVLGQGVTMPSLLKRLGLAHPKRHEYERHLGRLYALDRALRVLEREQSRGHLLPGVVSDIRDRYEAEIRREHAIIDDLEIESGQFREEQMLRTWRQALLAERAALRDLYRQGQLSAEAMDDLLADIDAALVRLEEPRSDQDLAAADLTWGSRAGPAARERAEPRTAPTPE